MNRLATSRIVVPGQVPTRALRPGVSQATIELPSYVRLHEADSM